MESMGTRDSVVSILEITADIFFREKFDFGGCDPEDVWTDEDYEKAKEFLDKITK